MKATLEFNLPEERAEFNMAKNGGRFYSALHDISEAVHRAIKYESWGTNNSLSKPQVFMLEKVQAFICDQLNACGLHDVEE